MLFALSGTFSFRRNGDSYVLRSMVKKAVKLVKTVKPVSDYDDSDGFDDADGFTGWLIRNHIHTVAPHDIQHINSVNRIDLAAHLVSATAVVGQLQPLEHVPDPLGAAHLIF